MTQPVVTEMLGSDLARGRHRYASTFDAAGVGSCGAMDAVGGVDVFYRESPSRRTPG